MTFSKMTSGKACCKLVKMQKIHAHVITEEEYVDKRGSSFSISTKTVKKNI